VTDSDQDGHARRGAGQERAVVKAKTANSEKRKIINLPFTPPAIVLADWGVLSMNSL
jgi:hypothetical protein